MYGKLWLIALDRVQGSESGYSGRVTSSLPIRYMIVYSFKRDSLECAGVPARMMQGYSARMMRGYSARMMRGYSARMMRGYSARMMQGYSARTMQLYSARMMQGYSARTDMGKVNQYGGIRKADEEHI